MAFSLQNASGTFHGTMSVILSTFKLRIALVYLNDIVMFWKNLEKHLKHVRHILTLPRDAGATLKLDKCRFFTDTIDYLGRVILPRRLEIASQTTNVIRELQPPTYLTDLQSFFGLRKVFQQFVPHFSRTATQLNK